MQPHGKQPFVAGKLLLSMPSCRPLAKYGTARTVRLAVIFCFCWCDLGKGERQEAFTAPFPKHCLAPDPLKEQIPICVEEMYIILLDGGHRK